MLAASVSASARAPSNDARRTNADRRARTCSTRSPSSDGTTQSPTATSAPMLRTRRRSPAAARAGRTVLQPRSSRDDPARASRARRGRCHASSNHVVPAERLQPGGPRGQRRSRDLVDEAPRQRRRGVDAGAAQARARRCGGGRCAGGCWPCRRRPGTSPRPSSGRAMHGVRRGDRRGGRGAGTSMPAPMHAPWRCTCRRSAIWWARRAGLRVRRVTWAVAGSGNEPNSPRSPPLQNDGPLPRQVHGGDRCRRRRRASAPPTARRAARPSRRCGGAAGSA